jgi:retinol dehydrogenase-12
VKLTRAFQSVAFKSPVYGAYSELYAALSPDLKEENNGGYILAWGRVGEIQEDVAKELKSKTEGGTGNAAKFVEYCNREIKAFL